MTCRTCENGNCKIVKENDMKCKKCKGEQFYTKRKNHKIISLVCSSCLSEAPIKEPKKDKKIEKEEEKGE